MSEITFTSVKDAVRWAEEMTTIPSIGSVLGNEIGGISCGGMSYHEVQDIAFTVSALTAAIKPWKGMSLKAVYGTRDANRDHLLGVALSSYLLGTEFGQSKKQSQLMQLGIATIKAMRAKRLYGDRFPLKRMAYDVGVSRTQFCNAPGWMDLRAQAFAHLQGWIEAGEGELAQELRNRGWMT